MPLNWGLRLLVVAAALLLAPERACPSHGRYWNLSWNPVATDPSNRTIMFHFQYVWATGFYANDNVVGAVINTDFIDYGDSGLGSSAPIPTQVLSVNAVQGWTFGQGVRQISPGVYAEGLVHTYATNGNFLANVSSCCRWTNVVNAGGDYRVETTVNAGTGNSSPVVSLPPIIQVIDNTVATFSVPAVDPNLNTMTFRLATIMEAANGFAYAQPPGLTINAATGMITWDITNAVQPTVVPGQYYTCQVMVEDRNTSGAVISKTPVDFLLQVVAAGGNSPPVFEVPTPLNVAAPAGQPMSFIVQASDVNATDTVSLSALNPPIGMTVTPVPAGPSPNPNAKAVQVNWTPPTGGTIIVIFQATDAPGGLTTFQAVTLNGPNPIPPGPKGEGSHAGAQGPTGSEGGFGFGSGGARSRFSKSANKSIARLVGPFQVGPSSDVYNVGYQEKTMQAQADDTTALAVAAGLVLALLALAALKVTLGSS